MINRIVRSALVAASSLFLLGGCAGYMSNVYAPERISALAPEEGRVILSVGAPVGCFISTTSLQITPYGEGFTNRPGVFVDHMAFKSDFADHQGSISVLNLRPGRYQVVTQSGNPYIRESQTPRYQFFLRPGENLYIGSFLMAQSCALQNSVIFVDQSRRDLPILFARNRLFDPASVTIRIAESDGYALGGPQTAGAHGPIDNSRWDATPPVIAARPPAPPPPPAPARPFDTTVAAVAQASTPPRAEIPYQGPPVIVPSEMIVARLQGQARALLHGQADRLSAPGRAALAAQFDRSLEASTPYVARRVDASIGGSDAEIVVSIARHAWLVGCSRIDASLSGECERQRGAAEAELSQILARSASSSGL